MKRLAHLVLATMPFLALLVACPPDGDDPEANPPILDEAHLGWKSQDCSSCKELPKPDHNTTQPPDCAVCHGGNGACDPGSPGSNRDCQADEECIGCHGENHGFIQLSECTACHFAAAGRDDCSPGMLDAGPSDSAIPDQARPDYAGQDTSGVDLALPDAAGPQLSTALTENCFNWPAEPFAQGNASQVQTYLQAGATAVEFTLADVDGNTETLSSLLASRPVLLVFGAFT